MNVNLVVHKSLMASFWELFWEHFFYNCKSLETICCALNLSIQMFKSSHLRIGGYYKYPQVYIHTLYVYLYPEICNHNSAITEAISECAASFDAKSFVSLCT